MSTSTPKVGAFKLRDKNTGLFSSGGAYPTWSTKGKTWRQMNHVKLHLTMLKNDYESAVSYAKSIEKRIAEGQIDLERYPWYNQYRTVKHPYDGCQLEIIALYYEVQDGDTIPVSYA